MWPNEQDFGSDTIIWDIQNAQKKLEPTAIALDKLRFDNLGNITANLSV